MRTPNKHWFIATILVFALSACAAFEKPQSFEEGLAYAYGTYTAVVDSATLALQAGSLSVEDAKQVQKLAAETKVLLGAAKLAYGAGDVSTAEGQLALATNILAQLQSYLRARK